MCATAHPHRALAGNRGGFAIEHLAANARRDLWHAAALALFSRQRLSDVLKVKWSDISDGLISVRQGKTGKWLWIPVHRRPAAIFAELPRDSVYG